MAYYRDLREFLDTLDRAGHLVRVKRRINKDTEIHPLVRLQFRGLPEKDRKAFLFENVSDSAGRNYRGSVATCVAAANLEMYALGLMCRPEEIGDKWAQARLHPVAPQMVTGGPAQEEVHVGANLLEHGGLAEFPITISTPGFDAGPYFTAPCFVTKDPETGSINVGTYRAHVKSPTLTAIAFGRPDQHMAQHWTKARKMGKPLEAALVQGVTPVINYVSVAKLAYGESEWGVAGGLTDEPVRLVKCRTVDLEVPEHAEIVVEGEVSIDEVEPEGPFGETLGYMGITGSSGCVFNVRCITHRKNPIMQSFFSEFPPSESTKIRGIARGTSLYKALRYDLGMPHVLSVAVHDDTSACGVVVISLQHGTAQDKVWETLEKAFQILAADSIMLTKMLIAVDDDIDPNDAASVNWALSFRMQPHRDTRIRSHPAEGLPLWAVIDHSIAPAAEVAARAQEFLEHPPTQSKLLMNATMKWDYPPLSLPRKELMENALELWQEMKLPPLTLRKPWWGNEYALWTGEDRMMANLAIEGKWEEVGRILAGKRRKITSPPGTFPS